MSGIDQLSMLPEHILENIFMLLSWEDAARMTVISRTWRSFWVMLPIFNFSFEQKFPYPKRFRGHTSKLKIRKKTLDFINDADQSLLDIRSKKVIIPRFRLCMYLIDPEMASHIDDWIELATKNCIRELDLEMLGDTPTVWYRVPPSTFAAKSLEFLRLKGCELEKPLFTAGRTFYSLRQVFLTAVCLDDETLRDIIFGCPVLEYFALINCVGVKMFQVPALPRLIELVVHDIETFEQINIEAVNLQSFHYRGCFKMLNISIICLNFLRKLGIDSVQITDDLFEDLLSKLPLLQSLSLVRCFGMTRAKISHCFLTELVLGLKKGLAIWEIETPMLLSFEYVCDELPDQFSINAPSLQEFYLRVNTKLTGYLDTRWFLALRVYLSKFDQLNALILFLPFKSATFMPDELNDIETPPFPVVKQLKLEKVGPPSSYKALLDGLLWSCHPAILAIEQAVHQKAKFIRFLCEKLIDRVEDPPCCINNQIRCWQHFLKDVRAEGVTTTEDRNALLSSLPKSRGPNPCPESSSN